MTGEVIALDDKDDDSDYEEYLTYSLGDELYGVKLLNVQEIRGWESVARVPNTPKYIKGVLNLRGTAVPIVDLRIRAKRDDVSYNATTVLIILRGHIFGSERRAGIVVDSVSDVLNASAKDIRKTPEFGDRIDTDFIKGLADSDGQMIMLFDAESFLKSADLHDEAEVLDEKKSS